jgi:SAM-dependent methyltransferase
MRLWTYYRQNLWNELWIQTKKDQVVLDVWCYDWYRLHTQIAKEKHAIDVDIDPKYDDVIYKRTDWTTLDYEDNTFDMVVSFEVIEHIESWKEKQYLAEMIRVLKPWWTLYMSTPSKDIKVFPRFLTNRVSKRWWHHKQNWYYTNEIDRFLVDINNIDVSYTSLKCRWYLNLYLLNRLIRGISNNILYSFIELIAKRDSQVEWLWWYLIINILKHNEIKD